MYAVLINDEIVALHEKLKPIKKFCKKQSSNSKIIKIKKRAVNKIFNKEDLYLQNYRGIYVPQIFLKDVSEYIESNYYSLINAICTLEDILGTDLSEKDKKCVKKSIEILIKENYNITGDFSDIKILKTLKELKGGF